MSTVKSLLSGALVTAILALAAAPATAAPVIDLGMSHAPSNFVVGGENEFTVELGNAGDEATSGPLTVTVDLPEGMQTRARSFFGGFFQSTVASRNPGELTMPPPLMSGWNCPTYSVAGESEITCTRTDPVPAGGTPPPKLVVFVDVLPGTSGTPSATVAVTGSGIGLQTDSEPAQISSSPAVFGIAASSLIADAFDFEAVPERHAGAHPWRAVAEFDLNTRKRPSPAEPPNSYTDNVDTLRNIEVKLPRGFVGNPGRFPYCSQQQLNNLACPKDAQVGVIDVTLRVQEDLGTSRNPVYNMKPSRGNLADFGFTVQGVPIHIVASLDPRDYSVVTRIGNINETLPVVRQVLTLWGVPTAPGHDADRVEDEVAGQPSGLEPTPFLSLPTECNVTDVSEIRVNAWQYPEAWTEKLFSEPVAANGCNELQFNPTIVARPSTNVADAPAGLEFELRIPQNEDPNGYATAHLRDAVVRLPEGMTVNPPSADGLGACSMEQVGIGADGVPTSYFLPSGQEEETPVRCPDSSKLGSVEVESPAVKGPLEGTVYLAEQNANPFGSLLAMYVVIDDPETGALVKLPGKVEPDPSTGRLTATFRNNPQLPVEALRMKLKEGPRAALKTPASCGVHTTATTLTPWSSPEAADATPSSSFELVRGPSGGACLNSGAGAPNTPSFAAGTADPTAKAFTSFGLKLTRADGTQQLKAIDTTLPKGLLGKLAGTTYCSDAALSSAAGKSGKDEKNSASCPASSRVGTVDVGAGAGSTPLYVGGNAYLAGPYKGAPLSLAIITPAVAGPFDLGTVVVRTKLDVNPENAQIHAVSDELPTILQGIPLNIRSVALKMDRPDFTLNPTSCDPMKVEGSVTSVFGQSAALSNPFQVGECDKLGFKPDLKLKLKGGTKRSQFPALTATVTARAGDANIGKTVVALPRSEFLAQSHIRTICTRVQYAAEQCPEGSIYGKATAWSPLLDQPLSGNVYLRSSSNPLPDMVVALEGQIDVDLVGRIDSFKKGIRTTFDTVPDAPVSKFVLQMQGGKKGLLENSRNLCKTVNKATVEMTGQNGATYDSTPVLQSKCKKSKAKKKHAGKKRGTKKTGKKG